MFTPITRLLQKNKGRKIIFLLICLFFMSAYPIYKNYINGGAINTYENYREVIEGRSKFYNPWQYRILCPLMIEGAKYLYDHTLDKIIPIEKIVHVDFKSTSGFTPDTEAFIHHLQNPDVIKYTIIFLVFRFIEDFLILLLSFYLLSYFIKNHWMVFLGLILVSWSLGNGVSVSDLSFNTYLDNVLYLLTGCIIVYRKNPWLIVPITIAGAFNRETSLLIPFLFFVSNMEIKFPLFSKENFSKKIWPSSKVFFISILSFIAFAAVFVGLRMHFGYRPQSEWKVPAGLPMLKLNLLSFVAIKGYFEMFGAFSIFPLICLLKFKNASRILKIWFIAIVPIWFFVHLYSVVDYQSRLFFVPTFLIFIPMVLEVIERNERTGNKAIYRNSASTARYISE